MNTYDTAILGLGTMGSATALELRRRGASVIGFDPFAPPHGNGSHSGDTRIFRLAHYDALNYVPLAKRAGELWDKLSCEFGVPLLHRIGLLKMGPQDDALLAGIAKAASTHDIPVERLSATEIRYRYPAFEIPEEFIGYFETTAGWIDVDASIRGMQKKARDLGAELCLDEGVQSWHSGRDGVIVRTARREICANRLIIVAGAWAVQILHELGLPIQLIRKTFFWFDPVKPQNFTDAALPVFGFPATIFYAFPNSRGAGVKVAEHKGGDEIDRPDAPLEPADPRSVLQTVSRFMPGLAGPPPGDARRIRKTSPCLYSMADDEHFIIDVHPELKNVVFAAGFSGHGFKFTPLIGEIMADLALQGDTEIPIDFLRYRGPRQSFPRVERG